MQPADSVDEPTTSSHHEADIPAWDQGRTQKDRHQQRWTFQRNDFRSQLMIGRSQIRCDVMALGLETKVPVARPSSGLVDRRFSQLPCDSQWDDTKKIHGCDYILLSLLSSWV